jgi:CheY-like chemotaxis protein
MSKARILLVEDNEQNRFLATFLLEQAGLKVVHATNGPQGLEKARTENPDLVLLDIQLPGIDGYEVFKKMQEDPELRKIPVVAVTSYAMQGERQKTFDMGFAGYLEKPINVSSFAKQVTAFLPNGGGQ